MLKDLASCSAFLFFFFLKTATFLLSYLHSQTTAHAEEMHISSRWILMSITQRHTPAHSHIEVWSPHNWICAQKKRDDGTSFLEDFNFRQSDKRGAESSARSRLLFVHLKYGTSAIFIGNAKDVCTLDSLISPKDAKRTHMWRNRVSHCTQVMKSRDEVMRCYCSNTRGGFLYSDYRCDADVAAYVVPASSQVPIIKVMLSLLSEDDF